MVYIGKVQQAVFITDRDDIFSSEDMDQYEAFNESIAPIHVMQPVLSLLTRDGLEIHWCIDDEYMVFRPSAQHPEPSLASWDVIRDIESDQFHRQEALVDLDETE